MLPPRMLPVSLPLLIALGCNATAGGDKSPADKIAAKQATEEAETAKRIEERKQKRLAEEKAKVDEAAALQKAVEDVCVLPAEIPKKLKLEKACADVSAAHDSFMLRHFSNPETVKKWNDGKGTQLPMTVAQCIKSGSVEVALCQTNAFNTAPETLKKEIPAIFKTCLDKFSTPSEPAPE